MSIFPAILDNAQIELTSPTIITPAARYCAGSVGSVAITFPNP